MTCLAVDGWSQFLAFVKARCSLSAFSNWIAPIKLIDSSETGVVLEVPNIFVQEYLLENFGQDLRAFLPVGSDGAASIRFEIAKEKPKPVVSPATSSEKQLSPLSMSQSGSGCAAITGAGSSQNFGSVYSQTQIRRREVVFNPNYCFDTYIEGASNQFVKSAALGVASRPGRSYNPLFIHGGVGLGKTHLLHAIGHFVRARHKKMRVHCITTEAFINELVDSLKNKRVDELKRFYRSLDVLLVDDIQFLQNRLNFEDEFCNTFEALINQSRQIVVTSDVPPGQLKLSERMIARMEWGLVAQVGVPDLETRVAIIQHKAELKGVTIPHSTAFFIAENIFGNVRQLEGAINRLSAQSRLLGDEINEDIVNEVLKEMIQRPKRRRISVEDVLKIVASTFQVRVSDLKGTLRRRDVALPRQLAMYLAKELVDEPLVMLGTSFGKTHSTILHACKTVEKKVASDVNLLRQMELIRHRLQST